MDMEKCKTQSNLKISDEVVRSIVKNSIAEIDGVASLSFLPMKYTVTARTSAKSIRVEYHSETAELNLAIIISMNHKIKPVCEQVQQTVKDAVQNMAGIAVSKVNVYVTGVHIPVQM